MIGLLVNIVLSVSLLTSNPQDMDEHWAEMNSHITPAVRELEVEATHYTAYCTGCIGITFTGVDVRRTIFTEDGYRVVAVDPNIIPLHSIVLIDGEAYKAEDIGSDIKGNRIDILVDTKKEAFQLGRINKTIYIVE